MHKQVWIRFAAAAAAMAVIAAVGTFDTPADVVSAEEQTSIVYEAPEFDPESSWKAESAMMAEAEEEAAKEERAKREATQKAAAEDAARMKAAAMDCIKPIPEDPNMTEVEFGMAKTAAPAQISRFEVPSWVKFDQNGVPVGYTKVHTGRACAYTANSNALMSTGKTVFQGYVAVNPNIIPYGSQLYIIADDGDVYGYAIAADTGYSVKVGDIIVDLFMSEYNDCIQWGNKNVSIYVLDPPAES